MMQVARKRPVAGFKEDPMDQALDPAYAFRVTSRIMKRLNESYFRSRFVGFEKSIRGSRAGAPVIYASNHSGMAFPREIGRASCRERG